MKKKPTFTAARNRSFAVARLYIIAYSIAVRRRLNAPLATLRVAHEERLLAEAENRPS
jgi:hypothetical protein